MNKITEGRIDTYPGPVPTRDISYFLYLFRAVYVAGVEAGYDRIPDEQLTDDLIKSAVSKIAASIKNIPREELSRLATRRLPDELELALDDIVRENPIRVTFCAATLALTAAVILSGGSFEFGPLKVELPPLGEGVQELRQAFGRPENDPKPRGNDDGPPSLGM
ncbi:hypothetical protein [Algiphilus sp.]|uniref:hypothetical protein n=1 Tax=Algiphilus sp. TaxID=1872431 RepID=UPI0025C10007|nr:hypothetical protein [Algiphilus sp.]MCK5769254.1 hypothetical protein [Algiphilus sp.]